MKPALLLSGHVIALGVLRALGENGVPVYVGTYDDGDVAQASRYTRRTFKLPNPQDQRAFVDRLLELGRQMGPALLVPGDDASLITISQFRRELAPHFILSCASEAAVALLIDKPACYAALPAGPACPPRTIDVTSAGEAGEASDAIGYPCIVKPRSSHEYYGRIGAKFRLVQERADAERAFTEAHAAGFAVGVQEYFAGPDELGINYNAYAVNGEVRVEFTARKERMTLGGGGVPSAVVSEHIPDVLEAGRHVLRALNYTGFACLEFKWDTKHRRYGFLEVNGRFNRSNLLATRCGINFPLIDYDFRVRGIVPSKHSFQEGRYWVDEFKDIGAIPARLRTGEFSFRGLLRTFGLRTAWAMWDWRDPGPFALRLGRALLSPVRRLRTRGRVILALAAIGFAGYMSTIYQFLAVSRPVSTDILVVESWMRYEATVAHAAREVRAHGYRQILCVAVDDDATASVPSAHFSKYMAHRLEANGVDPQIIHIVPVTYTPRDRTFQSADAIREWLAANSPNTRAVNVFTSNVHARKSWILYRKALEPQVKVGIIAGDAPPYPLGRWWLSSRGIYITLRNTAGYLYALAFRAPPRDGAQP